MTKATLQMLRCRSCEAGEVGRSVKVWELLMWKDDGRVMGSLGDCGIVGFLRARKEDRR